MILGVHTEEELMPHGYRQDGEVKQELMNLVNFTSSESKCDKLLSGKNLPNYSRLLIRPVIAKTVVGPFGHHSVVFNEVSFCYLFTGFTLDSLLRQHKYNSVQQNLED